MDVRKLGYLLAFYGGLLGELTIFVRTEFFHQPIDSTLVTMLGGLMAIGIANGAAPGPPQPPAASSDSSDPAAPKKP